MERLSRRAALLLPAMALLLGVPVLSAQTLPDGLPMLVASQPSRELLAAARTDLLYLRVDAAEARLRRLAARPDGQAAALYYLATASLLRGFLTDDDAQFSRFAERSDSLKAFLGTVPRSRWSYFLEAETDFQRAIVWGRLEKTTKAALAARSAFGGYARAADGAPGFAEPLKGLGLMHMVLGSLPSGYRSLLRLLGYSGSVEQGRAELARAAREGQYVQEEARMLLAIADIIIRSDAPAAMAGLAPLYQAHPRSPLVAHLYGYTLLAGSRADEAARVYAPIAAASTPGALPLHYATFYFADARFKQNRFDEAARLYGQFLERHRGQSLRAAAQMGLALSLEMMGRRADALPYYRQIRHTRTSETEELAVRVARYRLAAPLTPDEQALLKARNAAEGRGDGAAALALLQPLLARAPSLDARTRARARYQAARAADIGGQADAALEGYAAAIADPGPDPLDGLAPWSHFYAGQIEQARGRTAQARAHYSAALDAKGHFDRYLSLEQHVRTAREGVR